MRAPLLFTLLLCWTGYLAQAQISYDVDICVYGATSSGVLAAYTASKLGKKVVLVDAAGHIGGLTAGGAGYTNAPFKYTVQGLARDFYRRVGSHYGKFEQWTFEPKVADSVLRNYLITGSVPIELDAPIQDVLKDNNQVKNIVLKRILENGDQQVLSIHASVFIDCSYEGDLMAKAKIPFVIGREGNAVYNERHNGFLLNNAETLEQVDPFRERRNPGSGLIEGLTKNAGLVQGDGDENVQPLGFRICLTTNRNNFLPISRPRDYDSTQYELLLRYMETQPGKKKLSNYFNWYRLPNNKADVDANEFALTEKMNLAKRYLQASKEGRQAIVADITAYTQGLLYFLGHDTRVPLTIRQQMQQWGLPKDEFRANNHWSPQVNVREGRRMLGELVMTEQHAQNRQRVQDGICLSASTIQIAPVQRIVSGDKILNEGKVLVPEGQPFSISYRSIVPRENDASNVLVPVCASATHIASSAMRTEPVLMQLGQVAATSAVMAIDSATSVQRVDVNRLQLFMKENPYANGSGAEVLVDNEHIRNVNIQGKKWIAHVKGGYGNNFLYTSPDEKKFKTIRFTPTISSGGKYAVYMFVPKIDGCSDFMTVSVSDGIVMRERLLNLKRASMDEHESGEWISLGHQRLTPGKIPFVEVSTKHAKGKVVADAVMWVPLEAINY